MHKCTPGAPLMYDVTIVYIYIYIGICKLNPAFMDLAGFVSKGLFHPYGRVRQLQVVIFMQI